MSSRIAVLASATVAVEPAAAEPAPGATAQVLPGPYGFVSGLDLECYDTPGPALGPTLTLSHLNPVLRSLGLPAHKVAIRELQQTCVPVMKNGVAPPAGAAAFIRYVDLACYRVDSDPLPNPVVLNLNHLNPVLAGLSTHTVAMQAPAQLCVPVMKNDVVPPAEVLELVRYLDLECWNGTSSTHPPFGSGWIS